MFPVTVFYTTFNLNDFYPLGYSTNLPISIGKMSSSLLETFSSGAGTNAAANVIVSGGVTVTLPVKLNPALNLLVAQTASPAVHTRLTKTGYIPATPSLTGTVVYNGSVTGNWSISPYVPLTIPMPFYMGGSGMASTGDVSTFRQELGVNYPSFSMKRIFNDFTSAFYESAPDPWFMVKRVSGLGTASVSTVPLSGSDTTPGVTASTNYLGLLKISTKGTGGVLSADDRTTESSVFLSYGSRGFMHPINGGPISFKARIKPSALFTAANVCRLQVGLKGDLGANAVNFLNHYGLGFEVSSLDNSASITVICSIPGQITVVPTGEAFLTSRMYDLEIKISPFYKKAFFYLNSVLVHTQTLEYWPTDKEALVHPAVSHSTSTPIEQSLFVDYIYTTQKVNRG